MITIVNQMIKTKLQKINQLILRMDSTVKSNSYRTRLDKCAMAQLECMRFQVVSFFQIPLFSSFSSLSMGSSQTRLGSKREYICMHKEKKEKK